MLTKSRIFIISIICFFLGILSADFGGLQKIELNYLLPVALALMSLAILFARQKAVYLAAVWALIFFSGAGYFAFRMAKFDVPMPFNRDIYFIGRVVAESDETENQKIVLESSGGDLRQGARVWILTEKYPQFHYGDSLKIIGKLEQPGVIETADSPRPFDWNRYLKTRYGATGIIYQPKYIELVESAVLHRSAQGAFESNNKLSIGEYFIEKILSLRRYLLAKIGEILVAPSSALLQGLLLGVRAGFSDRFQEAMNASGTTHIVAISGFNIMIILMIFFKWLRPFSIKLAIWTGYSALLLFVILTGASASVVRAAIMGGLLLLSYQVGRQRYLLGALCLAALIMVIINPLILRADVGFQLSVGAVLGLFYISPLWEKYFSQFGWFRALPVLFSESITATLGAQIAVLPLLLYYFGRFSLVAPIANFLILPVIPLTMGLGGAALILGTINSWAGIIAASPAYLLLHYIVKSIEFWGGLPISAWELKKFSILAVIGYYAVLIVLMMIIYRQNKLKNQENQMVEDPV